MIFLIFLIYGVLARHVPYANKSFNSEELIQYREEVRELIYFGIDNYLDIAYPADELHPLSCAPSWRNFDDPMDFGFNDVMGNYSITLIDSLTTVAVIGDRDRFKQLVDLMEERFSHGFDTGSIVQVFEVTIRVLGSLMSAHLYASDPSKKVYLGDEYNGFLLDLAVDIADRLLPAYLTDSGIPVPRVNLSNSKTPLERGFNPNNNIVAMSSPYFEFRMLSYLTKDSKYEEVTRFSFEKAWSLRTMLNLVPSTFDPDTGVMVDSMTGIGASVDSFYEYTLKGAILFDDDDLLKIWQEAYSAISINAKEDWFFSVISAYGGYPSTSWLDSLSAFFSGLQVLAGDVSEAIAHNIMFMKLWGTFGALPERWDTNTAEEKQYINFNTGIPLYPLRPEFVESSWYLYRATKDPLYLNIGHRVLQDYKNKMKTECGFATIKSVETGEQEDRMESFVLSETLKYLFLLFDEDNEVHRSRDNLIFSTEAHPLWLTPEMKRDYQQNKYFNDTTYINHLDELKSGHKEWILKQKKEMNKQINKHLQKIFKYEAPIDSETRKDALKKLYAKRKLLEKNTELSFIEVYPVHEEFNNTCPVTHYDSSRNKGFFSPLMSTYGKMFDVNRRYDLEKPKYMENAPSIETEPVFYDRWCSPNSQSQFPSQAVTFDMVLDSTGNYDVIKYFNGSISGESFGGRRKLRIQRLKRGDVDWYGDYVSDRDFEGLDYTDIRPETPVSINRQDIYKVVKLDSIPIPKGQQVYIKSDLLSNDFNVSAVIADPFLNGKKSAFKRFGYNKDGHVISDNTLFVNFKII
ncbi:Uncharacterized protein RNJ44_00330 [Nakaseomyces bracarensis]|uniref:alpha-1,2-Mannosidase n=1 Tax=Nakaseomyces bracarensis TaxID=273131 RepID=A0ABR4NTT5_9SACH